MDPRIPSPSRSVEDTLFVQADSIQDRPVMSLDIQKVDEMTNSGIDSHPREGVKIFTKNLVFFLKVEILFQCENIEIDL